MSSSSPAASAVSGSAPPQPPHVVEDCMGIVQLLSDGTVTRSSDYSHLPILRDIPSDLPVQWKDVVYDATHALRLRMYRPTTVGKAKKLPVLVYFHGGGFCIASFEWPNFHAGALRLAGELPAIVLSADYRLAPEHRLPAAHEDAMAVFSWLRDQSSGDGDAWFAEFADFGRVFVCGDSAGGTIAHHIAVRLGSGALALGDQVRVAGCVILWPYFGGEQRTASEAEAEARLLVSSEFDPGRNFDQMWRMALPEGATRDHPAANPFGPESVPLDGVPFPPLLVAKAGKDRMRDRVAEYVNRLRAMGKNVELAEFAGQGHGFFVFEPLGKASDELVGVVKRFVYCTYGGHG
uniref:Uncharacterized protein n=1 Tax=Avena sativa TaxID=4498 RepID=A0ACD5Z9D9_AVESA